MGLGPIPSSPTSPSLEPSVLPYQSYQTSPLRRTTSIETPSPIRDPYRFRSSSVSARSVKSDYQAQTQVQSHLGMRQQSPTNSGYGYKIIEEHPIAGAIPSDEQNSTPVYPYHGSPTLSDNQSLIARTQSGQTGSGGAGVPGGSSPFQSYQPVHQQAHSPHQTNSYISTQERQDYRVDPYRSAYSQQQQQQQQQFQQTQYQGSFSPYHESSIPLDDLNQSNYDSRYSLSSSNSGVGMVSGQKYPMRSIHSHGSNQALSASYNQPSHSIEESTSAPSEFDSRRSDPYQEKEDASVIGTTTRSSTMQNQYPLTDANSGRGVQVKNGEDEADENAEILHRLSRGGHNRKSDYSSYSGKIGGKKSRNKKRSKFSSSVDDSEDEGQERGELRHRDGKRCWCCSRRQCVYITFLVLICLGIILFFVVPRSPAFSYESVTSMGDPAMTTNSVQELFSLQMRVDSSDNYVPLRITSIEMQASDKMWMKIDMTKVGNNNNIPSTFAIKPTVQSISVPMTIDYTSLMIDTNADGTLQGLLSACQPVSTSTGGDVLGLNLVFGGTIHFSGLSWIWKPQFSFNVDNVPCPVNANKTTTTTISPTTGATTTNATNATATSANQTMSATATVSGGISHTLTGATGSATSASSSSSITRVATPSQTN
ncbi:hypothetical protein BGZ49_003318 [Haplosporangium sp. Z 27]|nr:hypothetical protein BGZ49_003318 [Haplosporangium sp. Z 27]